MSDGLQTVRQERIVALDAFRGLTVAAMLLVNNPGSWSHIYPPLRHAAWHGWTPTDLIFPFFLFVVGFTTHLAIENRLEAGADRRKIMQRVARRGSLIILLGLLLNAFPFIAAGSIPGIEHPTVVQRLVHQLDTLRIPGVLQRIGVVYLVLGFWVALGPRRRKGSIASKGDASALGAILLGYWAILTLLPVPGSGLRGSAALNEPGETIAAWSDRVVFGTNHLWSQSRTWDPEGALSTLPAIATALLGLMVGRWFVESRDEQVRLKRLVFIGACLTVFGFAWGTVFPINKNLWTSSYVVFTAGAASLGIAVFVWAIESRGWRRLAAPALAFGVNPMLAFFASGIMARLLTSVIKVEVEGRRVPIQRVLYEGLFASWLPDKPASLAYAICFVLVWLAILWPLWRKNLIWKV